MSKTLKLRTLAVALASVLVLNPAITQAGDEPEAAIDDPAMENDGGETSTDASTDASGEGIPAGNPEPDGDQPVVDDEGQPKP